MWPSAVGLFVAVIGHTMTRSWLLVRFGWVGSDTYYHLMVGELLRKAGRLPFQHDRFVVPETVDYPPVVPFVVASWPPRWIRVLQYAGPAADFFTLAVVGAMAFWLQGLQAASLAMLVYASTPASFDMAYSFNPRPIANLFFALALASLLAVSHVGAGALLGAVAFGSLVLLTHRLTTQSLIVCALAYSFFSPLPALTTITLSALLAIVVSKGFYVQSLRGHLAFVRDLRNSLPIRWEPTTALVKALRGNPHLLAVVFLSAVQYPSLSRDALVLVAWIGTLLALAVVWPYGEGDRHFANASSLIALLVSLAQWDGVAGAVLAATVVAGVAIITAKLVMYPRLARRGASTIATEALRHACRTIGETWAPRSRPLVLSWPQSLSYQVMYFAQARGVVGSGGTGAGLAFNRALDVRLRELGLSALSQGEVPDFLVCVDQPPLSASNSSWVEIFHRDGVMVYQRQEAGLTEPSMQRTPGESTEGGKG